jgi:hypothetical protein
VDEIAKVPGRKLDVRRPGWRRWLRWLVGVLLLALIGGSVRSFIRHRQVTADLQEALAALDRDEPGWRLKDIEAARADIPEEENSARRVVALTKLLPKVSTRPPNGWPPGEFSDLFKNLPPAERLDEAQAPRLRSELDKVRLALELARTLERFTAGRHRVQYKRNVMDTLVEDQQRTRNVTWLLYYDAMQCAQEGDSKGALRACRAALNAARSLGDEPLCISQLVRTACVVVACQGVERVLAQVEPGSDDLAETQRPLENEDTFNGLLVSLRGERALMHELFEALESGDVPVGNLAGSGQARRSWSDGFLGWPIRDNVRAEHPQYLALMTRRIEEAELPFDLHAGAERAFDADLESLPREAILSRLFLKAMTKLGEPERRKHAHLRCLTAALAAERYRREHGAWPESLDKLVPAQLTAVPLDPFDGRPLRYRRTEDGVMIYSVGHDGIDDGGNLDREHPKQPGVDVGCRLWDVPHRRRPPQPKPPAPQAEPGDR